MAPIPTPETARISTQEAMDGSPSRIWFNDLTETGDAREGKFYSGAAGLLGMQPLFLFSGAAGSARRPRL